MAIRTIDDSKLQNIAVAIQNKDGGGTMTVDQMPTRIEQNLQSKAVLDSVIDGSITSIESDVTSIMPYKFYSCTSLVTANLPNVTEIGNNAFQGCSSLEEAVFPYVTGKIETAFNNCSKLKIAVLDRVTWLYSGVFFRCYTLEKVNIRNVDRIGSSTFWQCFMLNVIVLEKRVQLDNVSAFYQCPAITYVQPEDLEWYSTATNWSTLYADNRIKSIEDLTGDDLVWYQEQLARYQAA